MAALQMALSHTHCLISAGWIYSTRRGGWDSSIRSSLHSRSDGYETGKVIMCDHVDDMIGYSLMRTLVIHDMSDVLLELLNNKQNKQLLLKRMTEWSSLRITQQL